MSVQPYLEVVFDKDGDGAAGQREVLARLGVTDLVLFAHGWNSSRSVASRLYGAFLAPFPGLVGAGARVGYAGVFWPSMMFTDEPIPDFEGLTAQFPGKEGAVGRLGALLTERPSDEGAFAEFGALLRDLTDVGRAGAVPDGGAEEGVPEFLTGDPVEVYGMFAEALESLTDGGGPALFGGGLGRLWKGAEEALRQATYYTMKRRAGKVGERGLGPLLGELARTTPALRVHLVGHSMGARLVSFALRGLPSGTRNVKSVTLLQGAFSHYAFASSLPHDRDASGALRDMQRRVDGPVVACYSRHDSALGVIYPLASRLARDDSQVVGLDRRWWAIGHDGIQAVPGTRSLTLDEALRSGVPGSGCVNVDAASVVRTGGPPSGAHSDICHPELARVVVSAGRFGR
ncbi:alpha/beta hydrolase [Streptomyces solicathayae]|uniref:Alpha/beta hydrolase n=1 Tax=Streptomyces solicathayae TaxID=3081768 RepID=A0ABZ0M2N0_9ACTN|nr:alpha/beta hydrolase [Streptomyces sp. HUAS YS2]WOX25303.1 alpha/beta hydrolase [Streptomyces sp. HUAS YS2]